MMTVSVFESDCASQSSTPLYLYHADDWQPDDLDIPEHTKRWLNQHQFQASAGQTICCSDSQGILTAVYAGWNPNQDIISTVAKITAQLPAGQYRIFYTSSAVSTRQKHLAAIGWGLAHYQFTQCLSTPKPTITRQLLLADSLPISPLQSQLDAVYTVRDLINTPANILTPSALAEQAISLAKQHGAEVTHIVGEALIEQGYPLVHAVGRASEHAPQLVHFCWGEKNSSYPTLALIGKGVCFDSGGLQIKPGNAMQDMKKDMGGAAMVIGLAAWIMRNRWPVRLLVWLPIVENAISSNAFRPHDVLTSRSGKTVEIGHTDAEGRLILADCLSAASDHQPDLVIDMATLTGAQRIAMGYSTPSWFSRDSNTIWPYSQDSFAWEDPIWPLPLYLPDSNTLHSTIADLSSTGSSPYGGAISAALFLSHFVAEDIPWWHIDFSGFNLQSRPGYPKGGEAMGLRTLYYAIQQYLDLPSVNAK